jgi:hypothetical protein
MYRYIVLLHVLSAFLFFAVHGASITMAFRLCQEQQLDRIRALLDLSQAMMPITYYATMVMLGTGLIAGVIGHWFARGWIWLALLLVAAIFIWMYFYAYRYYSPIRKAVGLPYRDLKGDHPPISPKSEADIAALVRAANPTLLTAVSYGLVTVVTWLMVFKPF